MSASNLWCAESQDLLRYLYQDLKIFNWKTISQQIQKQIGLSVSAEECRQRYVRVFGVVPRNQWIPDEEKQLYRLHNQNGNRWATIAMNLLGRNDNCVKNHFYSKLRKSLRTINKIAKLHLRKQAKQISDVVIYKLTEATDQFLKQDCDISKKVINMCYELKNKLLEYDLDQKDIKDNLNYGMQKQLLNGLAQFNKIYKKKSKKEKIVLPENEVVKKKRSRKTQRDVNQEFSQYDDDSQYNSESFEANQDKELKNKQKQKNIENFDLQKNKLKIRKFPDNLSEDGVAVKSESDSQIKKTVNFLIKAPSNQQKAHLENSLQISPSKSNNIMLRNPAQITIPYFGFNVSANQPKTRIQDILKAQGILQNGVAQGMNSKFPRRSASIRSFSMCSQSENPDMFGEDLVFNNGLKQLNQMNNLQRIFRTQDRLFKTEDRVFRTQQNQ